MIISPFQIIGGVNNTTSAAVTTSSSQIPLMPVGYDGCQVVLTNIGSQPVFIAYGNVSATLTTCKPVLPNTSEVVTVPPGIKQLSAIAQHDGSTLYCTIGMGL